MYVKILAKANRDGLYYQAVKASNPEGNSFIVSSKYQLIEGCTYSATPKVHWIEDYQEGSILAHFRVTDNQIPMEQSF